MKLELSALIVGIAGSIFVLVAVTHHSAVPAIVLELVAPGSIGEQVLFSTLPIGLAGILLFVINFFRGQRRLWGLRFLMVLIFLASSFFWGFYD